mgnify:CR=1 FL=1
MSEFKHKWTTIKVPRELKDRIDSLRHRTGRVTWEVINEAVSFYEGFLRNPRVRANVSDLDKLSWYITKLSTSFGAFKENPSDENYQYIVKRVEELKKRYNIEADLLVRIADYYRRVKDEELRKKVRIDLNHAFKQTIKELIIQMLFELTIKEE